MAAKFGPNEVILPTATTDVGTTEGAIYYNTNTTSLRIRQAGGWKDVYTPPKVLEFKIWGAGGGSGSQQRGGTQYRTSTYYPVKQGGAGGFIYAKFEIDPTNIASLILSVGGPGRGALQQGNPSSASGGFNGGGNSTYSSNDAGGGGGGYSGVFITSKTQANALAISPGGGGGAGGPGYPSNTDDQANGGGGINSSNGTGNNGARNYGYFTAVAGGGTPTSGGAGGNASVSDGDGNSGSALTGGNANYYGNAWGAGGGGGGGWFGGGSGANDGNSWSGGGGGAGSAFVRGSGITYNTDGNSIIAGATYVSHTFYTEGFGSDNGTYNAMRVPQGTSDPQYPGGNVAYGGDFNTSPPNGLDGYSGAISYRINSGAWITITTVGDHTLVL